MKFVLARKSSRFLIFLIDYVLIAVLAGYIASPIEKSFGFDPEMMNTYAQSIYTELMSYLSGKSTDLTVFNTYLSKYAQYFMVDLGFKLILDFVFILGLLVILPKYWGGKTLGRRATNCKLIDKTGHDATLKHFILRELVGTFVFYCFLGSFFGLVGIVTLIMLIATSRSIPDLVSGTYVVYDIPANNQRSEEPKDEIKPDYHEVNNDYNEADNNSKEEDDQDKYSIDDDDYKIV